MAVWRAGLHSQPHRALASIQIGVNGVDSLPPVPPKSASLCVTPVNSLARVMDQINTVPGFAEAHHGQVEGVATHGSLRCLRGFALFRLKLCTRAPRYGGVVSHCAARTRPPVW